MLIIVPLTVSTVRSNNGFKMVVSEEGGVVVSLPAASQPSITDIFKWLVRQLSQLYTTNINREEKKSVSDRNSEEENLQKGARRKIPLERSKSPFGTLL
ncbi:hypothetical protein C0J52_27581 [Blattella germanica]|nr:hypothetical protein C0J52_27581 [Blattella germanica]